MWAEHGPAQFCCDDELPNDRRAEASAGFDVRAEAFKRISERQAMQTPATDEASTRNAGNRRSRATRRRDSCSARRLPQSQADNREAYRARFENFSALLKVAYTLCNAYATASRSVGVKRKRRLAEMKGEFWSRPETAEAILNGRRALGTRLRLLRRDLGLSREEAAEAIGVHAVQLARIESGEANFNVSTLFAMAVAYKVTVAEMFAPDARAPMSKAKRSVRRKGARVRPPPAR